MNKLRIWYSCDVCGARNEAVEVRFRHNEAEDIRHYVERVVGRAIGEQHQRLHAGCPARKMKNVVIPMPESARYIGDRDADYSKNQEPPDDGGFKPIDQKLT